MDIKNLFTEQELQDALQLHREQLKRLGVTLDDSISEILQKMLDNYTLKPRWSSEELLAIEDMPDPCDGCTMEPVCWIQGSSYCEKSYKYEAWKKVKKIDK